jgi:hypothetical protein
MGNWTHVICYNATTSDGYLHVQELYEHKLISLSFNCLLFNPHNIFNNSVSIMIDGFLTLFYTDLFAALA